MTKRDHGEQFAPQERVLVLMLLAMLTVIVVLGATRILDLDDQQLRYPTTTVAPAVYEVP